ncbi:hypothetical protein ACH4PU_05895 [Streptomyces sp. NPDC021100]|uniref:hypothetical protein n=1 Tax=Streptomyces sp. NPDC021100 TaxID=3365114 RepID=UPI0037ACF773
MGRYERSLELGNVGVALGWKQAFDDAMNELREIRERLERLDDPTVGLAALHGGVTQSRLKIQEAVQTGVTGLREENREVRRRQDRMTGDLNGTRAELFRQLGELADLLRAAAPPAAAPEPHPGDPAAAPHVDTTPDIDRQGETVENTGQRPQPHGEETDEASALKRAIETAYHGAETGGPAGTPPAALRPPEHRSEDPRVEHGVLLLKAAGVASTELVAHRDTWEWLCALAVRHSHFRTPPAVEDAKDGRIQTVLSGRSLIALLIELWNARSTVASLDADWALAATAYHRIASELATVSGRGETIRIVLDDGLPRTKEG